jgi:hypothetical protein
MIRNIYFNKGLHKNKKKLRTYAPRTILFHFQLRIKLLIESMSSQIKDL